MDKYIHLIGAEDVSRAGRNMQSAASEIQRAVNHLDEALDRHGRMMDERLDRLELILTKEENGD